MKWYHRALMALFAVCLAGGLIYSANHYHSKYEAEKTRADDAIQRANSSEVITANVIQSVKIMNSISEANQNAKNQIALDAQRAKEDIKMAVTGDVCANQLVPAGAVKRMREYADSLRICSGSTNTGQSNC